MEVANLLPVVDRLEDNIDDLEEALEPLLSRSLDETSKKLPLLERAKLHALLTYTLESLIFSYLNLHGTNAKEHPVFKELTRVRQYFVKIKALENPPEEEAKPTMKLDQQAARRFIAHGLAGNDQYDIERAEKQAKEKARAQLKAAMLAKKSKEESSASTPSQEPSKPSTEAESSESESEADSSSESEESEDETPTTEQVNTKPAKTVAPIEDFIMLPSEPVADSKNAKKKTAKAKAKQRKEDIINAKKAERQAKRQAKGIPEPDSKQQRKMARKERRRKKEAKRKEKTKDKKKQKQ
ncbi:Nuclear nucleic acid-binding protein C1D [Talaromyces pinophilus]|nr:Nuclear nucleic acid-binding protein C1D [Talaromyces pinophilus]